MKFKISNIQIRKAGYFVRYWELEIRNLLLALPFLVVVLQ